MDLLATLGLNGIPRARMSGTDVPGAAQREYLQRVQAEHESIYQAIADQDSEAARAAMRTHLVNSRERRRRALELVEK
ncbi:FCD domain protein [compost metagenome]